MKITNEKNSTNIADFYKKLPEKTGIRKTARFSAISYIILILIPVLWVDVYILYTTILGIPQGTALSIFTDPAVLQVVQIVLSSIMFLFPFLIVTAGTGDKLADIIEFRKPEKGVFAPLVLIAVGIFAFANIATNMISDIFRTFGIEYSSPSVEIPEGLFGFLLTLLATAVTPALVEEFAIRGILMGSLKKYGEGFAIVASSIIFGLMHCNFMQIPFAFAGGLAIGYAVVKTGSFWTGVLIHFINNFFSVILETLFNQLESVGVQTLITSVYFAFGFICFFIGIMLLKGRDSKTLEIENKNETLTEREKYKEFFTQPLIIVGIILTVVFSVRGM